MIKTWDEVKQSGSAHYKTGATEPIDLYLAGDMLYDFALCNIIKYAYRSRKAEDIDKETLEKNMNKIIHYTEQILSAFVGKEKDEKDGITDRSD